jgi:hypothetical protein
VNDGAQSLAEIRSRLKTRANTRIRAILLTTNDATHNHRRILGRDSTTVSGFESVPPRHWSRNRPEKNAVEQ